MKTNLFKLAMVVLSLTLTVGCFKSKNAARDNGAGLATPDGFGNEGGGGSGGGGGTPPPGGGGGGTPPPGGGGGGTPGVGQSYPGGHPLTYISTDAAVLAKEDDCLTLVNNHRASIGKPALTHVPLMRECARGHSAHMSSDFHNFFDHTNPEGDGPSQRYAAVGGSGGCGENIAGGYSTAQAAFDGWMSSPGHKANIEGNYTKTGLGYYAGPTYGHYWTQMFQ
jgi:hypothetical protein